MVRVLTHSGEPVGAAVELDGEEEDEGEERAGEDSVRRRGRRDGTMVCGRRTMDLYRRRTFGVWHLGRGFGHLIRVGRTFLSAIGR